MRKVGFLVATTALVFSVAVSADISNGGFESGDLSGWTLQTGAVEVLQSTNFSSPITVPEGSYYVLLSTMPDSQDGIDSGADRDNFDGNERDAAILSQTFTVTNAPADLSFSVAMITGEDTADSQADVFECLVDGVPVVQGASSSASGSSFPFAGPFDGIPYVVTSPGLTNTSSFTEGGVSSFKTVNRTINSSGTHTISCFVGDGFADGITDSGLLLDNVVLTQRTPVAPTGIPTVSTWGLLITSALLGLVGVFVRRRKV